MVSTYLPYNLFDILLALNPVDSVELSADELTKGKRSLRSVLDDRIGLVEKATRSAVRS